MKHITDEQFEILQNIEREFSQTLIREHFGEDSDAANKAFLENLRYSELPGMILSKVRYDFSRSASNDVNAKRLLKYCERAVPALTRIFGENALVAAMPEEARTRDILDVVEKNGAPQIAGLIKQAL